MDAALHKEWSDDEIAQRPLSKIWPKADVDAIEDTYIAALAHAARAEIPAKPRVAYKVDRWAQQVKLLRGLTLKVSDGKISKDALNEALSKNRTQQRKLTPEAIEYYRN